MGNRRQRGKPLGYVTSHPSQLSLAFLHGKKYQVKLGRKASYRVGDHSPDTLKFPDISLTIL